MITWILIAILGAALCAGGGFTWGVWFEAKNSRRICDRHADELESLRRTARSLWEETQRGSRAGPGELRVIRGGRSR